MKEKKDTKKHSLLAGLDEEDSLDLTDQKEASSAYFEEDSGVFVDDDTDSYYGEDTGEAKSEKKKVKPKHKGIKNLFGFLWWEFIVIIIEVLLLVYVLLVFTGILPLL